MGVTPVDKEPIQIVFTCRSRIKKWAFENALILVVMAAGFAVTWMALFIVGVKAYAG